MKLINLPPCSIPATGTHYETHKPNLHFQSLHTAPRRAPGGHGGPECLVLGALGGDAVEGHASATTASGGSWAIGVWG